MIAPFTPRAHKVIALARKEAISMGCNYVSTEHLLLGILREGEGMAYKILSAHEITMDTVREHLKVEEDEKEGIIKERAEALAKLNDRDRELLGLPRVL